MKKLLFAILFIVVCLAEAQAQFMHPQTSNTASTYRWEIEQRKNYRDSILRNNITSTTLYRKYYDKKGVLERSVLYREMTFDKNGDLVSETYYDHKGRPKHIYKHEYNSNGVQSSSMWYNAKGEFIRGWRFTFNELGLKVKLTNYWKREDKISWGHEYVYNADSNVIKTTGFTDKRADSYYIEYDYYANGDRKETRHYKKPGKLKSVLKYDCTPAGTLNNSRKADTTTYCSKSIYDADSNKIYTTEVIKQNGKIWRHISKVNKAGQLVEIKSVDHKGRDSYTMTFSYNANGKLVEETFTEPRHKRRGYIERYEYSPQGQRVKVQSFTHENQLQLETCTLIK